jgi:hypothetical protein
MPAGGGEAASGLRAELAMLFPLPQPTAAHAINSASADNWLTLRESDRWSALDMAAPSPSAKARGAFVGLGLAGSSLQTKLLNCRRPISSLLTNRCLNADIDTGCLAKFPNAETAGADRAQRMLQPRLRSGHMTAFSHSPRYVP